MTQADKFSTADSTPATDADGLSILADLARVSPAGRSESRRLRDVIRKVTAGDAMHLVGHAGLVIIKHTGKSGALAVAQALRDYKSPSIDPVEASKAMMLATIGQTMLDGLCEGPLYPVAARRDALWWAEELELLLIAGPIDARDEATLSHMQLTCDLCQVDPRQLSALLRAAFALVERDQPIQVRAFVDDDFVQRFWVQCSLWHEFGELPVIEPTVPRCYSRPSQPRRRDAPPAPSLPLLQFADLATT